ncbi:MAG: VCBS repeat-containing protein [Planctomycetes bacterium]|nr:VCBS repeat-containing protein [Planctomycetota bacterium]
MTRPLTLVVLLAAVAGSIHAAEAPGGSIAFKKTKLDGVFRSEGVAVGDYNHDGKLDIAAGSVYYAAPNWDLRAIRDKAEEWDPLKYSDSFVNYAEDFNGDGWIDLMVVDFPGKQTWWFENPKNEPGPWKRHECIAVTNNESPALLDIDGNGRRALVMAFAPSFKESDGPDRQQGIARRNADPFAPWTIQAVSEKAAPNTTKYSHGLGVGDINRDGRNDIVIPQGWWEHPASPAEGLWKFHEAKLGEPCAHMHVYDFDGDGDNDVLSSAAHKIGIWWHEQTPGGWVTHEIDKTFSQTHALCLADINEDGLPDFVTGKRWWAHGPKGDVNPGDPAVMYWFELRRENGKASWIPHPFDDDSGVGTQFEVTDVNGDGMLDVVTSNKKGVHYFQQVRIK